MVLRLFYFINLHQRLVDKHTTVILYISKLTITFNCDIYNKIRHIRYEYTQTRNETLLYFIFYQNDVRQLMSVQFLFLCLWNSYNICSSICIIYSIPYITYLSEVILRYYIIQLIKELTEVEFFCQNKFIIYMNLKIKILPTGFEK